MSGISVGLEQLVNLLRESVGDIVDLSSVSTDTRLTKDLGLSSINLGAFLLMCEEHFELSVFERADQISQLKTVGDMLKLLGECEKSELSTRNCCRC